MEQVLKQSFRPEFLNRLDEIVFYKPLTKENITAIIDLLLDKLNSRLREQLISCTVTPEAKTYIIDHGYDPVYGARPLRRYVLRHVETAIARVMLAEDIEPESVLVVDLHEGACA